MAVRYRTGYQTCPSGSAMIPEGCLDVVAEISRCAWGSVDAANNWRPGAGSPSFGPGIVTWYVNTLTRLPLTLTVVVLTEPASAGTDIAYKLFLLSFETGGVAFTASMLATNPDPPGEPDLGSINPAGQSHRPPDTSSTASSGKSSGLTTGSPGGLEQDGSVLGPPPPTLERGSRTT